MPIDKSRRLKIVLTPETTNGGNLVPPPSNLNRTTEIKVGDEVIEINPDNVKVVKELGHGAYGIVELIEHQPSGIRLAVKRIRASNLQDENRLLRDMDVLIKSRGCPNIVEFYGAIFWESDVYLFMEILDSSLDKFYRLAYKLVAPNGDGGGVVDSGGSSAIDTIAIPEPVLSRIAGSVVSALHYLHTLKVIHRDVKPSNILINRSGAVKLCDFGISGYLVNSVANTNDAGCKPYMAPERLMPKKQGYDIKSDVWSLGLALLEIAIGTFPYKQGNLFEQLKAIYTDPPPRLPTGRYSAEFEYFISKCLEKEYQDRPNYTQLLEFEFIKKYESADIAEFTAKVLDSEEQSSSSSSSNSGNTTPDVSKIVPALSGAASASASSPPTTTTSNSR